MKRTRIFAFALVLAMLFTLCACGSGGNAGNAGNAGSAGSADNNGQQAAITLRFAHTGAEDNYFNIAALAFKEEVEKRSGGTIKIEVFPNGQLGTLGEAVEGVQSGDIDLTVATTTTVESFCSDLAVFDLPFLVESYEQIDAALAGDVGEYLNEKIEENGLINLGWWEIGFRNLTCNTKADDIDDLAGLQIRIMSSEIFEKMIKALGMNPVTIDYSELYTALQQGAADGQENGYNQIVESSLYEVQKYVYETKHVYNPACFLIAPSTWNSLTEEQQKIIRESAEVANATCLEVNRETDQENRELCIEKGMEILDLDHDELRERCADIYDEYPQFADLVEKIDSYK